MPEPTEPKPVRYFFISYHAKAHNGVDIIGHVAFTSLGFPALLWITLELVPDQNKAINRYVENVVITNFYEFKSKEDFEDFAAGWDLSGTEYNFLHN